MCKPILVACCLLFFSGQILSQSDFIGFGFRAGLNYSRFDGPSEIGPSGQSLESFSMSNGFHIGAALNFKFTDLVGVRAEFVFAQRGTEYLYEGPSYYSLGQNTVQPTTLGGTRRQSMNVSNAYIDLPVTAYYKFGSFEILGGLNTGILVASSGGGSLDYTGISALGTPVAPFRINLNHNYKGDKAGEASSVTQRVDVDGRNYDIPTVTGGYYDFATKSKNLYKTLDFGLVAGASYFLNEGLFISARYIHGLGDIDRNDYDISLQTLSGGVPEVRADENRSKSWQFSIGFSF